MANLTVTIPDGKLQFFKNLVENLGFKYTENKEEKTNLPQWQKDELDKRLESYNDNPEQAIDFNMAMNAIEKELDL